MPSLWPSIAPRSVPLTMMPPVGRASYTALILVGIAWILLGLAFLMHTELAGEYLRSGTWQRLVPHVLLGASGLLALTSLVPALSGFKRARIRSALALMLALGWCAVVGWRLFGN